MNRNLRGFTLIELMVSLAIGLLVALAAVQMFVTNQQSFNLQRGMGDVQDNGRFALDYIGRDARMADLRPVSGQKMGRGVAMATADVPGSTATTITLDDSINLGIGSSDQLVIQYSVTPYSDRDCEGNVAPAGSVIVNRYFLRADATSGSASALACDGGSYVLATGAATGMGDQGVVLLSSVDSFQVLYGVNDGTASGCEPTRFVTATQFKALGGTPAIVAMKVGVLVRSQDSTGTLPASPAFQILDKSVASSAVPVDGRVRRLFTASMAMRNSTPDSCKVWG
ncbi:MAG TPA: PilW family protein [Fluviicoccus sp.]|nr:PilW family protein [Fluviicoccus sp.]